MTFGDNKCFLVQINSHVGPAPAGPSVADVWVKYLIRHTKADIPTDPNSAPRTPQDFSGVTSMPATVQMSSLETPPSGIIVEEVLDHPLSPTQELATEAIVRVYPAISQR